MQTEILKSPTDQIREQAALGQRQSAVRAGTGGLLQTGETVQGYVIQKLLSSEGGEAEIYLCTKGNQHYVLKYFYTRSPDPEILQKLFSFSVKHPDIVSYIAGGQYKERYFLILEYAEGGALDEKKTDGTYKYLPVTEETALQIVKETINAFDICHKNGIIHRDIKPGNLFYKNAETETSGSDILVGDFGIASAFEADQGMSKHVTKAGGAHTTGYAAPEVFTGVIGPEMDYYALGVTLWVLLTGKEPFVNENGHPLYEGQIALDTIQGKTADLLLARSPELSAKMRKFIRGLLTVRHEKRWGFKEVSRFLAGEDVEVFSEAVRDLPPLEIAGEKHYDYKSIAEALLAHPEEGKNLVFKGKLTAWLVRIDQEFAEKILDIIETYSANKRLDKGLVFVAYSLCPSLPFTVDHDKKIMSLQDMTGILETDPGAVIPYLRDEKNGLYTYFEAIGLADIAQKVWEVVKAVPENFKLIPRITVALKGNAIKPFQDGINNDLELREIEQLYNLPEYLQERTLLFIERRCGDLPAWIENLTGKNLELWLYKLDHQREKLIAWGKWQYFTLFLQGNDIQCVEKFEKNGRWGLKDPFGNVLLLPVWGEYFGDCSTDRFIVKKNGKYGVITTDGKIIVPFEYDYIEVWDEERHLYQVALRLDDDYDDKGERQIITEDRKVLYSGAELEYYSTPGNPYEFIHNWEILFTSEFEIIKELGDGFCFVHGGYNLPGTNLFPYVYIWYKENGKVFVRDGSGTITETAYSDYEGYSTKKAQWIIVENKGLFGVSDAKGKLMINTEYDLIKEAGENLFFVKKNKKWGLVRYTTNKIIQDCIFGKIQTNNYDSYNILFSRIVNHTETFIVFDAAHNKSLFTIKKSSDSYDILDQNRKIVLKAKYVLGLTDDYDKDGYRDEKFIFEVNNGGIRLFCFDGNDFVSVEPESQKIRTRWITEVDGKYLCRVFNGDELWSFLNNLRKQDKIKEVNQLVNATWNYFFDNKKDWETARRILFFIKPDNMEGLDYSYDYYRACIGRTLQEQENYEDAVEFYEEAIRLDPDRWYNWRCGDCYYSIANYQKALHHFEKALELEPDDQWLFNRKGDALYGLGRYKESISCYTMAIEKERKSVFYNNRGNAYETLGMQDKADADYREAKKYE